MSRKISPLLKKEGLKKSPLFSTSEDRSWLALYTKTLINILAIPVQINPHNQTARFQIFSIQTLFCLIIYFGVYFGYALLMVLQPEFARDNLAAWLATHSVFDCVSAFIFIANCYFVPLLLLLMAHAFPKLSKISMARNLTRPRYIQFIMLAFGCFVLGPFFLKLGEFLSLSPKLEAYPFSTRIIMLFAVPFLSYVVIAICANIFAVLSVSWISHLIIICLSTPPKNKEVDWARHCLDYYHKLDKHLGLFFFLEFSATLVMWMFALFLAITFPIGSTTTYPFILSCLSIGYCLNSLGFLFSLTAICNVNDDLHASLNNVVETLMDLPDSGEDKTIIKLIRSLEKVGPISPFGLFTIERSTITSMISISVTYLIILVQFKMSF